MDHWPTNANHSHMSFRIQTSATLVQLISYTTQFEQHLHSVGLEEASKDTHFIELSSSFYPNYFVPG